METINELIGMDVPLWLIIIAGVVFVANLITSVTPTKIDDEIAGVVYNPIMKVINTLALNVFKNKNADDK